jgi:LETM1 and EF-hand domain-containing protein 1
VRNKCSGRTVFINTPFKASEEMATLRAGIVQPEGIIRLTTRASGLRTNFSATRLRKVHGYSTRNIISIGGIISGVHRHGPTQTAWNGYISRRYQSSKSTDPKLDAQTGSKSGQHATNATETAKPDAPAVATAPVAVDKPRMTIWQKVKHEAQHYWDGTKLLGYEIKVSTKLLAKMSAGYELTRRENRQLGRTTQDLIRLVPFAMFIIIPFAELLLPFALKLFPNLLPSTYESGKEKEAKLKKLRKTRGNVSQLLRQTVSESGMVFPMVTTPEQKVQFATFFQQVRSSVQRPSRELIVTVAHMFREDIVLDNLSRPQLVAMAKYMNIHPYGTNLMLRYSIRHRMRQIKRDDRAIDYEGIESLSVPELQSACASRGIRTHGVSAGKLRDDLATWLELRLHKKVPSTLLVLSSAYSYGDTEKLDSYYDGILAVLSALPEELYHEAELEVSSTSATNKQRLEVLKEQQELIQDENAEEEESGHVIKVKDDLSIEEDEHEHPKIGDSPEESKNESETESKGEGDGERKQPTR